MLFGGNMRKRELLIFLLFALTFSLTSCRSTAFDFSSSQSSAIGQNSQGVSTSQTPYIKDGNWYVGDVDTGVKAQGEDGKSITITSAEVIDVDGQKYTVIIFSDGTEVRIPHGINGTDGFDGENGKDGVDGYTPYIKDGYWYINGVSTGVKAEGSDGEDGRTPYIKDGYWYIGSTNTGVKAEGMDGQDGVDGITPHIGDNGNWWIGDQDTGIKAEGDRVELRLNGTNIEWRTSSDSGWHILFDVTILQGNDGTDGKSAYEIYKMYCGYEGTEEEWIHDLVTGKLVFQDPGEIEYIAPIRLRVVQGEPIALPSRVNANFESGTVEEVNVIWNRPEVNSDFIGEKKILGWVDGYPERVECYVRVASYSTADHYIDGYINGIMADDKVTITAYNDNYLETITPSWTGYYCFDDLEPGTYYLTLDANGYEAIEADTCTIGEVTAEPTSVFSNIAHQNFNLQTLRESGYYFMWTDTEDGPSIETISSVDNEVNVDFLSEAQKAKASDVGAASALRDQYNLILSDEKMAWSSQSSSRFYEIYSLLPESVTEDLKSVWNLTTDHLQYDVEYGLVDDHYEVLLSADTLANSTPRSVEIDGVKGKYFSNRLYNAILRFVTDSGRDATKCEKILNENYSCSFNVPDYEALTAGTTNETAASFQEFPADEKLLILTMFEEMPEGMHQMPELKYLVRRQTGTHHPIYTSAGAVTWTTAAEPYIEFMDSAFADNAGYYDAKRLIIHEKMHIFYQYHFSDALKEQWYDVGGWYKNPDDPDGWSTTKETEFVSAYAHQHNPDEDMAESFATYVIDPMLLKSRSIEKYNFIKNYIASGTSYLISTREDLQFEVYNLCPDYIYPGKVKSIINKVTGGYFEDKTLTTRIKLWGNSKEEGAASFYYRIAPQINDCGQFYDVRGNAVDLLGLELEGSERISKYSARSYWYTDQIQLTDNVGNYRYVNGLDFGFKVFFDNPLEDLDAPTFVKNSLKLTIQNANNPEHPSEQVLKIEFDYDEKFGVASVVARLVCLDINKDSIDVYADMNDVDQVNGHAVVEITIPEFFATGTYAVEEVIVTDLAQNKMMEAATYGGLAGENRTIQITTTNPDTEGPTMDINDIHVSAVPSIPEAPNGETFVTVTMKIKDNISGFKIGGIRLLNPLGVQYFKWIYPTPYWDTTYFQLGNPTEWREYSFTITLPKGSAPGTWGIYEISLTDFAMNQSVYNFAEIIHFEVDE